MSFRTGTKRARGGRFIRKGRNGGDTVGRLLRKRRSIQPARFRKSFNQRTGGFLGIELKFYDTAGSSIAFVAPSDSAGGEMNQSATIGPTTITQGDGEQQRDGRKATIKSVFLNGMIEVPIQVNQTATETTPVYYICLVQDMQTNGALLNSEDVFTNPGAIAKLSSSPLRNLQFSSRFRVLSRTRIESRQPTVVYDGTNIEQGGFQIPFTLSWKGNMNVTYKGTTETIANTVDNSISVIGFSSNVSAAPTLSYNCRCRFVG